MTINLKKPDITELKPRITVFGVGGGGGNAVNNMINAGLDPVAACQVAMVNPITDDSELAEALMEVVQAHFG